MMRAADGTVVEVFEWQFGGRHRHCTHEPRRAGDVAEVRRGLRLCAAGDRRRSVADVRRLHADGTTSREIHAVLDRPPRVAAPAGRRRSQNRRPFDPTKHIALFNHKNLDGWTVWLHDHHRDDPSRVFSVVDGMIRISGEEWGGIATAGAYRDYRLVVEWKWGGATWGERKDRARDSGILVHGVGADGAASGNWLESIESQVIEGGAGDYIVVAGAGHPSVKAHARVDGEETYWDAAADVRTIAEGRLNWFGRDPQWKDQLGFRGRRDVERRDRRMEPSGDRGGWRSVDDDSEWREGKRGVRGVTSRGTDSASVGSEPRFSSAALTSIH